MYTAEQASRIKETFWLKLGKYLAPIPGSNGDKVNWINYKTGIKNLYFKMDVDRVSALISIEILHKDRELAKRIYYEFEKLRGDLENTMLETWHWEFECNNEYGSQFSQISARLEGVNIFNEEDWPTIISFLKQRILLLDQFWNNNKMIFEVL